MFKSLEIKNFFRNNFALAVIDDNEVDLSVNKCAVREVASYIFVGWLLDKGVCVVPDCPVVGNGIKGDYVIVDQFEEISDLLCCQGLFKF